MGPLDLKAEFWRAPLYDLAARNLGLVTQREHLHLPPDAERLALDMTQPEFLREERLLPLRWRLVLRFIRPIFWALTATEAGRHRTWDAFSSRWSTRAGRAPDSPLHALIKTKRDKAMSARLQAFVQDPLRIETGGAAAVVAGAAHMPALYVTLRDCGFRKGSVRWFEVLEGLRVPARGTDGRAFRAVP